MAPTLSVLFMRKILESCENRDHLAGRVRP
jgi:hypothetical protein